MYEIMGLLLDSEVLNRVEPMREVLSVTIAYSSMKPFFEPAKRHRRESTSAAAHKSTGARAENRMIAVNAMV